MIWTIYFVPSFVILMKEESQLYLFRSRIFLPDFRVILCKNRFGGICRFSHICRVIKKIIIFNF